MTSHAPHTPFNRNFWLAAAALSLVGGLALGQVSGLNDDIDAANTAAAAVSAGLYAPDRLEVRNINMELQRAGDPALDADFSEVDAALGGL